MKILLTGANGQVGHELRHSLLGVGEVVALDRAGLDLSDLGQVSDVIRALRPGLIINAAAYTAVDQAEKEAELAMRINAEAPTLMAQEAARIGAGLVHYSTDYVFDGTKQGAYVEADVPAPLNVYGQTKLAGERGIAAAGAPHLILRTSWVYGARGKNFLLTMQRLARERDTLRVVSDQHGAPTWSRTIAATTASLLLRLGAPEEWRESGGLYHLTCSGQTSWHGFAQAIVAGSRLERKPQVLAIPSAEYPTPARRPANSVLACDRLAGLVGALPAWQDALGQCLKEIPGP